MADELLDLVDEKDYVIGDIWKSQAHGNPMFIHREVAIVVFNDNGQVLLQQRSFKKTSPGVWKLSAAGHVVKGEDPVVAVTRELFEELGIEVNPVFYKKIFRKRIEKNKILESRFFWIYYALVKGNPSVKLDPEEVSDAKWVDLNKLEKFSKENNYSLKDISHETIIEIAKELKII